MQTLQDDIDDAQNLHDDTNLVQNTRTNQKESVGHKNVVIQKNATNLVAPSVPGSSNMLHPGEAERKYQYRVNRVLGIPGSMEEKDSLELQDLVKAGACFSVEKVLFSYNLNNELFCVEKW